MTEADLQRKVTDLAQTYGWLFYHTFDSRRSHKGFPDLTLVRGDRLVFMELKSDTGKTTPEQLVWLTRLSETPAEVYLVYPDHMQEVADILSKRPSEGRTFECAWP